MTAVATLPGAQNGTSGALAECKQAPHSAAFAMAPTGEPRLSAGRPADSGQWGRHRIAPHAYDQRVGSPTVVEEHEFEVSRVEAVGGPSGAGAAFDLLEERMPSLRGRKMYGILYPGHPDRYFACLRLDNAYSDDLGLERAIVPGGLYGRSHVRDWNTRIQELPRLFDALRDALVGSGYLISDTRPLIEYYRRMDALTIMMPVIGENDAG